MRRRLSILTLICCSLLCTVVRVGYVWADSFIGKIDTSGSTGNGENDSGTPGSAPSDGRQTIAHGYRISLVYAEVENNHKVGEKVAGTYPVDYWSKDYGYSKYYDSYVSGYSTVLGRSRNATKETGRCIFSEDKNTRQELLNKDNKLTCGDKSSTKFFNSKYNKKNEDMKLSNGSMVFDETHGSNTDGSYVYRSGKIGDKKSGNYFAYDAGVAISKNFFEKDTNSSDYDWKALNQYLVNCGYEVSDDPKTNVQSASSSNYILQIEPIMATVMTDSGITNVYVGSMAELFKMWYKKGWYKSWYTDEGSTTSGGFSKYTDLYPVLFANGTGTLAGIKLSNGDGLLTTSSNNFNDSGLGVALFRLDKIKVDCPSQVKNAYKDYRENKINASNYNSKVAAACDNDSGCFYLKVDNTNGYSAYGIDPSSIKSCDMPTCNDVAKQKITSTNLILKETIKNLLIKLLKENQTLKEPSKDGSVSNMFVYKYGLTGNSKLCDPNSCSNILSGIQNNKTLTEEQKRGKVGLLYNLFKNSGLDVSLLDEANYGPDGMDKKVSELTCKGIPPGCTGSSSGDCKSGSLTFSDTKKVDCIKYGIAYYDSNKSHLQSSKSSAYSTDGHNVYCTEEVKFELPQGISNHVKAGTMLKWGKDIETGLFGTMAITRTCYNDNNSSKINDIKSIDTSWAKTQYIKTQIQIIYNDPTENYSITNYIDSPKLNGDVAVSGNTKKFTMVANYDFYYGKNFRWYSDKGDTFKAINYNETDKKADNSSPKENYVEIGYGLPTSFTTPEGTLNGTLNGGLTAVISNIGTYTGGGYHFDKYVKYNIDENSKLNNGVKYSCEFYIENELFGNECYDENGKAYDGGPDYCKPDTSPKGLDVVFRTIDLMDNSTDEELDRAFPGMSGKGITENNSPRKMGSNWNEIYNNGADDGAKKIFNILNSSIYNKEPMYKINLSVSLIQDIRIFNRDMRDDERDPYSYMGTDTGDGHAGYTFYKEDNDETSYAFSNFLEYLTKDCTTTNRDGEKTSCLVVNYDCVNTNNKAKRSYCHQ